MFGEVTVNRLLRLLSELRLRIRPSFYSVRGYKRFLPQNRDSRSVEHLFSVHSTRPTGSNYKHFPPAT
jgi:hypothetical protein